MQMRNGCTPGGPGSSRGRDSASPSATKAIPTRCRLCRSPQPGLVAALSATEQRNQHRLRRNRRSPHAGPRPHRRRNADLAAAPVAEQAKPPTRLAVPSGVYSVASREVQVQEARNYRASCSCTTRRRQSLPTKWGASRAGGFAFLYAVPLCRQITPVWSGVVLSFGNRGRGYNGD